MSSFHGRGVCYIALSPTFNSYICRYKYHYFSHTIIYPPIYPPCMGQLYVGVSHNFHLVSISLVYPYNMASICHYSSDIFIILHIMNHWSLQLRPHVFTENLVNWKSMIFKEVNFMFLNEIKLRINSVSDPHSLVNQTSWFAAIVATYCFITAPTKKL